jgi:LemA protein
VDSAEDLLAAVEAVAVEEHSNRESFIKKYKRSENMLFLIIVIVLLVLLTVSYQNKFVKLHERVKNSWSQIDVQLQKRVDLIPNLVETVKGYATHEKETLDAVISARTRYTTASTVDEKMKASGELSGLLSRLMMVSESYPDLKANVNFMDLQKQLKDIEDKIGYARQFYNDTVTSYNQSIKMIPGSIFAGIFKFTEEPLFKADEGAKEAPKVKF